MSRRGWVRGKDDAPAIDEARVANFGAKNCTEDEENWIDAGEERMWTVWLLYRSKKIFDCAKNILENFLRERFSWCEMNISGVQNMYVTDKWVD